MQGQKAVECSCAAVSGRPGFQADSTYLYRGGGWQCASSASCHRRHQPAASLARLWGAPFCSQHCQGTEEELQKACSICTVFLTTWWPQPMQHISACKPCHAFCAGVAVITWDDVLQAAWLAWHKVRQLLLPAGCAGIPGEGRASFACVTRAVRIPAGRPDKAAVKDGHKLLLSTWRTGIHAPPLAVYISTGMCCLQAHLTEAQAKVQHLEDELELLRKRLDWCEQQTQDAEAKARAAINAAHRASTQVHRRSVAPLKAADYRVLSGPLVENHVCYAALPLHRHVDEIHWLLHEFYDDVKHLQAWDAGWRGRAKPGHRAGRCLGRRGKGI